jgi:Ni/Fe-hydrogenase subunit HybB-like protein
MPSINLSDLPNLALFFFARVILPLLIVTGVGWIVWKRYAPHEAVKARLNFGQFLFYLREPSRIRFPELSPRLLFALPMVVMVWLAAAGVLIVRFFWGLGAVTALSDDVPWGLWIGFDVMAGVALAAGGFSLAAVVYVFRLEAYRPILRPAILTALLGYSLVVVGLVVDLGRWYNIWHPLVMWNPHSVMFEVAWCVMLYTTVLMLEFSPAVFERFHIKWAERFLHKIIVPLVILGCVLSTLHQSSLGSLYLIFSTKLSPVWWSPLLPILFFVSALAVGLSMVLVEASLTAKAFKRTLENDLLATLVKPIMALLTMYAVIRFGDLIVRGSLPRLLTPGLSSALFWIEMFIGVFLPLALFATRKGRENPVWRFRIAVLVIASVLMNRMDIAVFGFYDYTAAQGTVYLPSLGEWAVTAGLVTFGVVAYALLVKYLPVLPVEKHPLRRAEVGAD